MNDFERIGAGFDLITPLWAFAQDLLHGSHADFGVNSWVYQRSEIKRYLKRHGVDSWGYFIHSDDMLYFTTSREQARYAKYILERAKVALLYWPACAE